MQRDPGLIWQESDLFEMILGLRESDTNDRPVERPKAARPLD